MASWSTFCFICAVPVHGPAQEYSWDYEPWMARARFISISAREGEFGPENPQSVPYLSSEARIAPQHREPILEVYDYLSNQYQEAPFGILRFDLGDARLDDSYRPQGYPIHQACWHILRSLLLLDDESNTSTMSEKMGKLQEVLDNTSCSSSDLEWPHEHYGLARCRFDEWKLPTEFSFALADPWDIKENPNLDQISIETSGSNEAPILFPLPVELIENIFSYLDWIDISNIQKLAVTCQSMESFEISDAFWKSFFLPGAEFGYFSLNKFIEIIPPDISWFHLCCLARNGNLPWPGVKNRSRIWMICKALADQVLDIVESERFGINDEMSSSQPIVWSDTPPNISCTVESEAQYQDDGSKHSFWDGTAPLYEGELRVEAFITVRLSYSGSGNLMFLSGLTFLPSGQSIGFITKRQRSINMSDFASQTIYLSIAASGFGVLDISFSESIDQPCWAPKSRESKETEVAIKRRIITLPVENIIVRGKWDVSKFTKISISTTSVSQDLDENEKFVQDHMWMPSAPPSYLNLNPSTLTEVRPPFEGDNTNARFIPFRQAIFKDKTLTSIVSYVDEPGDFITGIVFYFAEDAIWLGNLGGFDTEFPIDGKGGEHIVTITILTKKGQRYMTGMIIETNLDRRAIFCAKKCDTESESVSKQWRLVSPDSRIVGLYYAMGPELQNVGVKSFGIITSGAIECSNVDVPKLLKGQSFINATNFASDIKPRKIWSLKRNVSTFYSNWAPLKNCKVIYCNIKRVPETRVVGLHLGYSDPSIWEPGKMRLLGQLRGYEMIPLAVYLEASTYVKSIHIYYRAKSHTESTRYISCLRVNTSDGESVRWGEENYMGDHKKIIKLRPNSVLRWDFNEQFDKLSKDDKYGVQYDNKNSIAVAVSKSWYKLRRNPIAGFLSYP